MNTRSLLLSLTWFIAACVEPAPVDDTDTEVDTDIETDLTDHTDPPETDNTDETDGVDAHVTTIQTLRRNLDALTEGTRVQISGVIVTAVRSVGQPRGFTVQDPALTAFAGLFVGVDAAALPVVGDVVTVTGAYQEDEDGNPSAPAPAQTLTRVDVTTADPDSGWEKTATGTLPNPATVTLSDLSQAAETWESMRVRLLDRDRLEISQVFDDGDAFDVQRVGQSGSTRRIGSVFRLLTGDLAGLAVNDTFGLIDGVLFWQGGRHVVGPVNGGDLGDYEVYTPDTDTDTVGTDETDVETDETDVETDTDTDTIDTTPFETDTYEPFETGETDTDTDPDTTYTPTSPSNIRLQIHSVGQYLQLSNLVVTARRLRVSPASTNGFFAQDPNASQNGGIYIHMAAEQTIPQVGDVVTVVGIYEEWPNGATVPGQTQSRLNAGSVYPDTSVTVLSSGATLPTPVELGLSDLTTPVSGTGAAEKYESMRARLTDASGGFAVKSNPAGSDFQIGPQGTGTNRLLVSDWIFDLRSLYSVNTADTFTSLTGVVHHQVTAYKFTATQAGDVVGYVDN